MRWMILLATVWLSILTLAVVWPIVGNAPWEVVEVDSRALLCEDALVRRRESQRILATMGRERQQTVIDAKRLGELEEEAQRDVERYCFVTP